MFTVGLAIQFNPVFNQRLQLKTQYNGRAKGVLADVLPSVLVVKWIEIVGRVARNLDVNLLKVSGCILTGDPRCALAAFLRRYCQQGQRYTATSQPEQQKRGHHAERARFAISRYPTR